MSDMRGYTGGGGDDGGGGGGDDGGSDGRDGRGGASVMYDVDASVPRGATGGGGSGGGGHGGGGGGGGKEVAGAGAETKAKAAKATGDMPLEEIGEKVGNWFKDLWSQLIEEDDDDVDDAKWRDRRRGRGGTPSGAVDLRNVEDGQEMEMELVMTPEVGVVRAELV